MSRDDMASIEVLGLEDLEERLTNLGNLESGKVLTSAAGFALTPVVKEARQRAAVAKEPHIMTKKGGKKVKVEPGLLSSAIRKKSLPKKEHTGEFSQGKVVGVYVGKGRKQKEYPNYWHLVEYGTVKMQATPFIRPAFDNNVDLMLDRFILKAGRAIDKYTEGG